MDDLAVKVSPPAPGEPAQFNRTRACRYGQMLYNINDMYVGRSLDLYGEFSEGEVVLFRDVLGAGDVVVDVGANIGAHTLFFARHVGSAGRVIAFEPQRIVFQTLCANMALNSLTNVWCYPCAVAAEPGKVLVPPVDYNQPNNFGGISVGAYAEGEVVPTVALDEFRLPSCALIKIDVEGMEQSVLAGAVETIERLKPFLYVENDRADRADELVRFIADLGYALYWHCPRLYNPDNYLRNPDNVFGDVASRNVFCVHRSAPVSLVDFEEVEIPPAP
jgi:FkbM family methyltransferase